MEEEEETPKEKITVDIRVYMHCDACEKLVRRTIKKFEGVETVKIDREDNTANVTGCFETEELLKKIKKKTGKRAEIVENCEENSDEERIEECFPAPGDDLLPRHNQEAVMAHYFHEWVHADLNYFDEENANACNIM